MKVVFIHLIPLSKIREQKDQESERMLQFLLHSFLDAYNLHPSAGDGSGSSPSKPCIPFSKRRHGNVNVPLSILMSDASALFFFLMFLNLFLMGRYLFYRVMLVPATHQHETAVSVHISPTF